MGKIIINNKMFARVVLRRTFALDNTRTMTRHIQDRVVSTGQWPVPFYERHYKPMTVGQTTREDMSNVAAPIGVTDVENTRNHLSRTAAGRQILQHFENHAKVQSYVVRQDDTGNMAKAYCADLIKYIDVANKENKRILNATSLL